MLDDKKRQLVTVAHIQSHELIKKVLSMLVEMLKSIEIVLEKRLAVKARFYNNSGLINWVDFGSVRENFSYSLFKHSASLAEQGALIFDPVNKFVYLPIFELL